MPETDGTSAPKLKATFSRSPGRLIGRIFSQRDRQGGDRGTAVGGSSLSRRFDGPPTNLPLAETGRRGSTEVEQATAGSSGSESQGGGIPTDQVTFRTSDEAGKRSGLRPPTGAFGARVPRTVFLCHSTYSLLATLCGGAVRVVGVRSVPAIVVAVFTALTAADVDSAGLEFVTWCRLGGQQVRRGLACRRDGAGWFTSVDADEPNLNLA